MYFLVNGHLGILYNLYIRIEFVDKVHEILLYKNKIHKTVLYYTNFTGALFSNYTFDCSMYAKSQISMKNISVAC